MFYEKNIFKTLWFKILMHVIMTIYRQQAKHWEVAYNFYTTGKRFGGCLQFLYSRQNIWRLLTIYIQQANHWNVADNLYTAGKTLGSCLQFIIVQQAKHWEFVYNL